MRTFRRGDLVTWAKQTDKRKAEALKRLRGEHGEGPFRVSDAELSSSCDCGEGKDSIFHALDPLCARYRDHVAPQRITIETPDGEITFPSSWFTRAT